jgi:hypothetical protein
VILFGTTTTLELLVSNMGLKKFVYFGFIV